MNNTDLMNSYLNQQFNETYNSNSLQEDSVPTESDLEEFRKYVTHYIDIDNDIKKLKGALRDRNSVKNELTSYIIKFMVKFNIEDLNTKQGKIRYNVKKQKAPLSQKTIKEKLEELHNPSISCKELTEKIFDNRSTVEKHSLRRLK
jgi:DNA repair ATPase RecN